MYCCSLFVIGLVVIICHRYCVSYLSLSFGLPASITVKRMPLLAFARWLARCRDSLLSRELLLSQPAGIQASHRLVHLLCCCRHYYRYQRSASHPSLSPAPSQTAQLKRV